MDATQQWVKCVTISINSLFLMILETCSIFSKKGSLSPRLSIAVCYPPLEDRSLLAFRDLKKRLRHFTVIHR